MTKTSHSNLPIVQIIDDINENLTRFNQLILEAPPGAGKTTLVPLSILEHQQQCDTQIKANEHSWLKNKKIILLEPRRIAARNAAMRMANLLNEKVGETIGYRMRGDSAISEKTRIEVITQGVLTRMLQADPALESVGAILFDEFHERQLDSDLALSLCQYSNQLFREENPIKLVVMSATLEQIPLERVLPHAKILHCTGRCYPVEIHYRPAPKQNAKHNGLYSNSKRQQLNHLLDHFVDTTLNALSQHSGSVLVFLPGIKEIKHCHDILVKQLASDHSIEISPLYGGLSPQEQQNAIQPCRSGHRKVVLTTSIAESSLTIEGVSIVIDSGLSRHAIFTPQTGLSRLVTNPVSRATATQRAGRAGRLTEGVCYRLWSEQDHHQKQEHTPPEIKQTDLTDTILQLSQMGITPSELDWLDKPPIAHIKQAIEGLKTLNAINTESDLNSLISTSRGEAIAKLPIPVLAASLLVSTEQHKPQTIDTAIDLAALILEGDILYSASEPISADITLRLNALKNRSKQEFPAHQSTIELLRKRYKLKNNSSSSNNTLSDTNLGELCALALPHRIAKQMDHSGTSYKLASGEIVTLSESDPLRNYEWLVVIDIFSQNHARKAQNQFDKIRMAAPLTIDDLLNKQGLLADLNLVKEHTSIGWQDNSEQLIATQSLRIGCLTLNERKLNNLSPEVKLNALLTWIKETQLNCLPWDKETQNLQARVALINSTQPNVLPDLSKEALQDKLDIWLAPYLNNITRQKQLEKLPLHQILLDQLDWSQQQTLAARAPKTIQIPSGSTVSIDYTQQPPVMAAKLQEMFGYTGTPTINNGKTALMIHLLSPARRPLQITQDLASFWKNGYQEVKKENKAKYAKHPWPDDPLTAVATKLTNRRLRETTREKE